MASTMWSCGPSPLLPLDSGLVQQIRRLRRGTLKMCASGLVFIRVGLAQQQVDFDRPKVRAIVRATIRIHHASVRATICTHHAVFLYLRK
jgi:hypothetical protein